MGNIIKKQLLTMPVQRSLKNRFLYSLQYVLNAPLKRKLLYLRRILLRLSGRTVPMALWIGVTYRCQCRCVHCLVGPQLNKNNYELTADEIRRQIEEARRIGFMEICFVGGEPLLREDIVDLVDFSDKKGLLTTIVTNGILLTSDKAEALKNAGLTRCNISLDSAMPMQHDSLRGHSGCYEKALAGIGNLLTRGIECSIWTYVKKADVQGDLPDLKAIIEIGKNLKVRDVFVMYPCASGNWINSTNNILTGPERAKVRKFVELCDRPPAVKLEFPSEESRCTAGNKFIYINPHGGVTPCPAMACSAGNVRSEPLKGILEKLNSGLSGLKTGRGQCLVNIDSSIANKDDRISSNERQ